MSRDTTNFSYYYDDCSTCVWGDIGMIEDRDVAGMRLLLCHRYPPTVVADPLTDELRQVRPQVRETEWCGEWTRKPLSKRERTPIPTTTRARPNTPPTGREGL